MEGLDDIPSEASGFEFCKAACDPAVQVIDASRKCLDVKGLTPKRIGSCGWIVVVNDVLVLDCVASNGGAGTDQSANNVSILAAFGPVIEPLIEVLKMVS